MAATNVQAFSGDVEVASNLAVDTNTLLVDSVGNRVGIGTSKPIARLNIVQDFGGAGPGVPVANVVAADGLTRFGIYVGEKVADPFSQTCLRCIYDTDTVLVADGFNRRVGIGKTSPETVLHVLSSDSSTSNQTLKLENPYIFGFNTGLDIGSSIVFKNRWQGDGITDPIDTVTIEGRKENNANYGDSYISFKTRYETDRANGGAGTLTEKMRITSTGKVGIGKTDPGTTLDVAGNITGSGGTFTGSGDGVLKVSNTSTPAVARIVTSGGKVYFQSGTALTSDSRADMIFTSMYAGTGYLTILGSNGNVGIGRTNPGSTLDVNGTMLASRNASPANYSFFDTLGSTDGTWRTAFSVGSTAIGFFSVQSYSAGVSQSVAIWYYEYKAGGTSGGVGRILGSASPSFRLNGQTVEHNGNGGNHNTQVRVLPFII